MLLLRLQTHRIGIFPCLSGSAGAHGPLTHSFIPSAFALQVPFHLGQAVASATDPSTPRTYAGIRILSVLLSKAVKDGVCSGNPTPGATGGLQRSIHSQLQQSGFTAAVPQLLDSATAALNNISAEPALAQVPQQSSYNWIVTSAQTATVAGRVLSTQAATRTLLMLLSQCLSLQIWPSEVDVAAVALPALRACAAALQPLC
jgi:hypothetical protein